MAKSYVLKWQKGRMTNLHLGFDQNQTQLLGDETKIKFTLALNHFLPEETNTITDGDSTATKSYKWTGSYFRKQVFLRAPCDTKKHS